MATATDNCDPSLTLTFVAPPTIPVGINSVGFLTQDASGNSGFCFTQLTVAEGTAVPELSHRTA